MIAQIPNHGVLLPRLVLIAISSCLLLVSALVAQAESFTYSNNFSGATNGKIDTSPNNTKGDYFYAYDESSRNYLWEYLNQQIKASWSGVAGVGSAGFVVRNFHDGGLLDQGAYLLNPTATVTTWWTNGNSFDTKLWNYVGFLDASGKGYVAGINRTGVAAIFRLDSGLTSDTASWVQLGSKDLGFSLATNTNLNLTFSISGSTLTLGSSGSGQSLSVALTSLEYSEFTTIVLGGKLISETMKFDDLTVNATVIPEPSSVALIISGIILGGACYSRKPLK